MSENLEIQVLYEDDDLAVLQKPAGLVVNTARTVQEQTLQDWWMKRSGSQEISKEKWNSLVPEDFASEYGSPEAVFAERGGIVHRLDKETSGVIVVAKNPGALVALLQQFRLRVTEKKYICLVHGKFQITQDTIQMPLGRSSFNRTKFAVASDGRVAETAYTVLKYYPKVDSEKIAQMSDVRLLRKKMEKSYQGFSLVECQPKTGRTHQIRVHMLHLHHPIVSDETYLGKKRSTLDIVWCPRLFLHARELSFTHPRSGKRLSFTAELPADLKAAQLFLLEE